MSRIKLFALSALVAASASAFADSVVVIDYDALTASKLETFSGGAVTNPTFFASSASDGAMFSERFKGQTVSQVGGLEVLSGNPSTMPFAVDSTSILTSKTVAITSDGRLGGLSADGTVGTGAVSIQLPNAQEFGLQVDNIDGNSTITFRFFDSSGRVLGTEIINTGSTSGSAKYAFSYLHAGNEYDARIDGVSITTTDAGGLLYDNVRYGDRTIASMPPVAAVPEPETYALMLGGLSIVGFAAKRRRQKRAA
jgi:hypothetical protein